MKVFTDKEFINRLKWLVNEVPNVYHSENGTWCTKHDGKVWLDCVVSIKGLLWGFINDYSINNRGGAVYLSNGVADFTPDGGLNYCEDVSQDFGNIKPGEYLCMKGTGHGHAGIYLGNGKVFECTVAWNTNKCIISDIDKYGNRSLNGVRCLKWTYHGKLNYIDYRMEYNMKHKIGERVKIDKVYVSSESVNPLTPAITEGTITRIIEGARNPYLLDDGNIGWVNDDCIIEEKPTDYKVLYEEELKKNKELEVTNNNLRVINDQLQEKINKAIKDLS